MKHMNRFTVKALLLQDKFNLLTFGKIIIIKHQHYNFMSAKLIVKVIIDIIIKHINLMCIVIYST